MPLDDTKLGFAKALLDWYQINKRPLPWRDREADGYAIWISEIMLQQTTVNAVIGYYNRWMERFPTLISLAEAPLDDVLKLWAGLGYYARARNLKAAADQVVQRFGGEIPANPKDLMSLPGIGRYTAGAISSISFGRDEPLVDANVVRVLCRIFALTGDPKTSTVLQARLWEAADILLPKGQAGDYNQALMELGALICQPAAPNCIRCPVERFCEARLTGDPTTFPQFGASKKWIDVQHAACVVEFGGKVLMVQRPLDQLWGGLWELPRVSVELDECVKDAALRALRETVGIEVDTAVGFGSLRHVVTNRRITLHGLTAHWDGIGELKPLACRQFAWVKPDDIDNYAVSSPQIELLSILTKSKLQPTLGV